MAGVFAPQSMPTFHCGAKSDAGMLELGWAAWQGHRTPYFRKGTETPFFQDLVGPSLARAIFQDLVGPSLARRAIFQDLVGPSLARAIFQDLVEPSLKRDLSLSAWPAQVLVAVDPSPLKTNALFRATTVFQVVPMFSRLPDSSLVFPQHRYLKRSRLLSDSLDSIAEAVASNHLSLFLSVHGVLRPTCLRLAWEPGAVTSSRYSLVLPWCGQQLIGIKVIRHSRLHHVIQHSNMQEATYI